MHLKLRKTTRVGESLYVSCCYDYIAYLLTLCRIDSLKPHISGSSRILHNCPSSSGGPDGRPRRYREDGTLPPLPVLVVAAALYFAVVLAVLAARFGLLSFALQALLFAALVAALESVP